MGAIQTVAQRPQFYKLSKSTAEIPFVSVPTALKPRRGVVTLCGYGINVRVDRGHLVVQDGIGSDRHLGRFPRVGHGLKRLVIIGADGMVSLAALRWLADQNAAFVMLDRDGSVLATTGPVRPSDARLRRAQALAAQTGTDLIIARELIHSKLAGQEWVAREKLHDADAAQAIADCKLAIAETDSLDAVRWLESKGAATYWAAWRNVQITFPKKDLPRVPEHWRKFDTRKSPLSGSPRLAANPANAMLNYLYALLESETRLAASALGLDAGLGFIHMDTPARDSLACDLMEPVRPLVDAYLLDWITQQPLRRESFFERRDGNCRLMAPFTVRLSETAPMWARAVAPFAESVARTLWSGRKRAGDNAQPPTRLTQRRKREAKGSFVATPVRMPQHDNICRGCGKVIDSRSVNCSNCNKPISSERLTKFAHAGRVAAHSPGAEAHRAETQRRNTTARHAWRPADQPGWLTETTYAKRIQPAIKSVKNSAIASALCVSLSYAANIRRGKRCPHPRHWLALAKLAGVSPDA